MVRYGRLRYEIEIPNEITAELDGSQVTINGPKGEVTRDFGHTEVRIERDEDKFVLTTLFPQKNEKALIGTVQAHLENMINGVLYGYKYYLKIVFSHFPIRVVAENDKDRVKIENLYGGRKPRYAKILPGVTVSVDDEDVIVEGANKDYVGQTSANIQEICRQKGSRRKSPKTFMDGIYIYQKEFQEDPSEEITI